jgi:hypothetical protein
LPPRRPAISCLRVCRSRALMLRCAVLERQVAAQPAGAVTTANATFHSQVTKTLMALSVHLPIGPRSRDTNRRPAKVGSRDVEFL